MPLFLYQPEYKQQWGVARGGTLWQQDLDDRAGVPLVKGGGHRGDGERDHARTKVVAAFKKKKR
jgi:hypothetical protein